MIKQLSQLPWLKVVHYGFQRLIAAQPLEGRDYPPNIEVIDAAALEKPLKQGFGYEQLPAEIARVKPNIVMIYNDMAVISQFMEAIKRSGIERNFQTWFYVDQVYDCQLNMFIEVINREADRVFAFTQAWKDCLKEQGVHRPIDVIAHGFDDSVFKPVPKSYARKALNLPENVTILLSINRNQPRKRYDLLIMAFVELIAKYPSQQIVLLCVCDKGEKGGWNLFEIFARELKQRSLPLQQFGNRLMISSRDMEFRDEDINMFYNAADLCVATADGEGFGLCTFESMGVGVPQVVPDVGGFKEFCRADNSIIVKPKFRYYLPSVFCPVGGEAWACDPHDICMGIESYINDSELRASHGAAGMAAVKKYTWKSVVGTFINRLRNAHSELEE
jgi:glycosyltransferase involved in cell wall biosynthesis